MSKLTDRFGPLPKGIKPGQPAPPGWKWSAGGKHLIPESFVDGTHRPTNQPSKPSPSSVFHGRHSAADPRAAEIFP